jgi:hypothetical protein
MTLIKIGRTKKIFFYGSSILLLFFAGIGYLPEKISYKIYHFTYYIIPKAFKKTMEPITNICLFHESKLACQLECNGKSINPGCFINKKLLDEKIHKGLPQWAKEQIREDLAIFPAINKSDLNKYAVENGTLHNIIIKVEVKNKKYISPAIEYNFMSYWHGNNVIKYLLEYLANNNYITDTSFLLALNDYVIPKSKNPVPIFCFAKDVSIPIERSLILMPDWQNLGSTPDLRKRIKTASKAIQWHDKTDKLFWRGGEKLDSTGFRKKLVFFAASHPNVIDVDFVNSYGKNKNVVKNFITPEEHLEHKYLISIDGMRASWERLVWHLHSNSLVFKHNSSHVQWFYKGIKPYVDYVPIENEQDILKSIIWAERNQEKVQGIIEHSTGFVEENLTLEDMAHYIIVLLEEYNKRLKN